MDVRITRGPTRWGARTLVVGLTISMVAIAIAIAVAEFTLTPPTAQTKAALDRSAADNAAQPKAAAKKAEAQPPATEPQQPQFIYSPWTKICTKVRAPHRVGPRVMRTSMTPPLLAAQPQGPRRALV